MPLDGSVSAQMRVEVRSIDLSAVSDAHNGDNIASDFTTNLQSRDEFMKTFLPEFSSGARRKFLHRQCGT